MSFSLSHRLRGLAMAIALIALQAAGPGTPQAAAATTPCSDDQVTVMVEGFATGCANPGGNGYDTLRAAGFSVTVTQNQSDFICRINGSPDASVDKCLTASPVDAYWSYWHATLDGDSWEYSNLGAFAYYPEAGSVEAWTWGAGEEPGSIPSSRASESTADGSTSNSGLSNIDPALLAAEPLTTTANGQAASGTRATPTPETNPDNPDEVVVYLDAEGRRISKQEYEALASGAVTPSSASESSTQPSSGAAATESEKPKSTLVMQAPAGDEGATSKDVTTTAATQGTDSQKWLIGMTIAFIALTAAAATATWAIRKKETQG